MKGQGQCGVLLKKIRFLKEKIGYEWWCIHGEDFEACGWVEFHQRGSEIVY